MKWTVLIAALALTGCATTLSTEKAASLRTEVSQMGTSDICVMLHGRTGHTPSEATANINQIMVDELVSRDAITADEYATASQHKIQMGMGECGLLIAFGRPDDINRTVIQGAPISKQYVYRAIYSATYVYTEGGKITAWQD
ncbi:MAG: hypothetical protein ABW149_00010 [Sedimenticola sp.]